MKNRLAIDSELAFIPESMMLEHNKYFAFQPICSLAINAHRPAKLRLRERNCRLCPFFCGFWFPILYVAKTLLHEFEAC